MIHILTNITKAAIPNVLYFFLNLIEKISRLGLFCYERMFNCSIAKSKDHSHLADFFLTFANAITFENDDLFAN
jgi:hypothetical protein